MLHVVTGGSGSGKSEYAEKLIAESALHRRIYVATMMVWDDEGRKRVRRHREMRSGKGFITIEHYTGLSSLELSTCDKQSTGATLSIGEKMALAAAVREKALPQDGENTSVLLECMSNLLANEMFENDGAGDKAVEEIIIGIDSLINCTENTVIVSNDIFGDGINYAGKTREYINNLGLINRYISLKADMIYEIVCGIPIAIKENYIC